MGRHPYRVREIAQQAGLSEATVDRVLNQRPGVRPSTAAEVWRAVSDLQDQASQLRLVGRTFLIDLVMQAPSRFSGAVRRALEAELPGLRPATLRCRFHLGDEGDPGHVVATLRSVARTGSAGVLLKAPDDPAVVAEVDRLVGQGIPVITLVTDLPLSRRLAYVGIDNRSAGATAAYLVDRWSPGAGSVLVALSSSTYRGEEEREIGFRTTLRRLAPGREIVEVSGTHGLDAAMLEATTAALAGDADLDAVYSIGGGNAAVVRAFDQAARPLRAFVAHDLDGDNTRLLRQHRISAVLHHDLRADVRHACRLVMQAHGALPGTARSVPSQIQVITPYNEPGAFTVRE